MNLLPHPVLLWLISPTSNYPISEHMNSEWVVMQIYTSAHFLLTGLQDSLPGFCLLIAHTDILLAQLGHRPQDVWSFSSAAPSPYIRIPHHPAFSLFFLPLSPVSLSLSHSHAYNQIVCVNPARLGLLSASSPLCTGLSGAVVSHTSRNQKLHSFILEKKIEKRDTDGCRLYKRHLNCCLSLYPARFTLPTSGGNGRPRRWGDRPIRSMQCLLMRAGVPRITPTICISSLAAGFKAI